MKTQKYFEAKKFIRQLKIDITFPLGIKIFVFGSFLFSSTPNDVDIIVLYDEKKIPPSSIIKDFAEYKSIIEKEYNLDANIIYLSFSEEKKINFIKTVNALPIN